MKKVLFFAVIVGIAGLILFARWQKSRVSTPACPLVPHTAAVMPGSGAGTQALLEEAVELLKLRRDTQAQERLTLVLAQEPGSLDALWAQAELLRRNRDYAESEALLLKVLLENPRHISSLISLSNIRYKQGRLDDANALIKSVLSSEPLDDENRALAYVMLGGIDSERALKGWLADKIKYGTKIKGRLLQARALAPYLPEVHFALGSFYCLAPRIIGGNLDKAIEELECAVSIAPEFASACARLAQSYKKKGKMEQYSLYLKRVQTIDPKNEILSELLK